MKINFFFNNPNKAKESNLPYSIYMSFSFQGESYKINTGEKLHYSHFNPKARFEAMVTPKYTKDTRNSKRLILEHFEEIMKSIEKVAEDFHDGKIKENVLRERFAMAIGKKVNATNNILDYFQIFYDFKFHQGLSGNTLKVYRNTKNVVSEMIKENPKKIFDVFDMDVEFFYEMRAYFSRKKGAVSTYNKHLKNIKSFMNWLSEEHGEMKIGYYYKKEKYIQEIEKEPYRVEDDEIVLLSNLVLTGNLEGHRDMFLFQLYTGQRHSGIAPLAKSLIAINEEKRIYNLYDKKTKKNFSVPLSSNAMDIYFKYKEKGKMPVFANQKRNDSLKILFKLAKINRKIEIVEQIMGVPEPIRTLVPLDEVISTHAARKTLISILSDKYTFHVIKQMTGHSDPKTLRAYQAKNQESVIRIIEEETNHLKSNLLNENPEK